VDELYLAALSRFPTESERNVLLRGAFGAERPRAGGGVEEVRAGRDVTEIERRRAATEDILWVLLNSKEFLYNH
jgi:hypothetical protein